MVCAKALQAPSALWKYMAEEGESVDPAIWCGLAPKESRRDTNEDPCRPCTPKELEILMNGPARTDPKDAMTISLYTGMRLSEVGDLRVGRVDTAKVTIVVPGGKNHNALRMIIVDPKLTALLKSRTGGKDTRTFAMHELGDEITWEGSCLTSP